MIDPFVRLLWPLFCSIVIALLSMYQRAHAFVPKAKTIIEKTADNHGKGYYSIQLEVSFRNDLGTQTVTENWVVENGDGMFVEAKGSGFHYAAVYRKKTKYFMDDRGAEKSARLSQDFFEDLFHFRGADSLGSEFVAMGVIPPKALSREHKIRTLKDVRYERENFVRLSRAAGVVNYALGRPTPPNSTPLPGVWIEQDRFHIRRIRFPSATELTADDYNDFSRNLSYPRTRTVTWGQSSVSIRTVKIAAINPTNEIKSKLSPSFLRTRKQTQIQLVATENELSPLIKEFYQRFR